MGNMQRCIGLKASGMLNFSVSGGIYGGKKFRNK